MRKISNKEIKEIQKSVKKEFPCDPALQEIHIARKILAKEAEKAGLTYFEHIKSLISKKAVKL